MPVLNTLLVRRHGGGAFWRGTVKRSIASLAAAIVAIGIIATPVAAQAATGPGGDTISCLVQLDHPHGSGHVQGTISAASRVTCTKDVASIFNKVTLLNVPKKTSSTESDLIANTKSVMEVAAKPCSEGPSQFRSSQQIEINFPPGYKPTPDIENNSSPVTSVACGNAKRVAAADSATVDPKPTVTSYTITAVKAD